jgi:hypothetical protein
MSASSIMNVSRRYPDEQVKLFTASDFAFHKVSVVFWQFEELLRKEVDVGNR